LANAAKNEPAEKLDRLPAKFDRRRFAIRFRATLPSTRDSINLAVREVLKIARAAGCPASDAADVEIALREALANAIFHGNGSRPEKKVFLRCYGDPGNGILLAIRDEGPGFDPAAVPDPRLKERLQLPHGRGIFLMHELMDLADHRKGGREVVLYKACRGRRAARKTPVRPGCGSPAG
jgi:serine/threonine-protein kinase RsbW